MPRTARPLNEQIDAATKRLGVSQRELGRRLALIDGSKSESKRRWLAKVLAGDVDPGPESVAEIEEALGLDAGHFKLTAPASLPPRKDRLRVLEEEAADRTAAGVALVKAVSVLLEQVEALGGTVPAETRQELARAAARMQRGVRRR